MFLKEHRLNQINKYMTKITITRSYSEKLSLGNYQTADFGATRTMEVDLEVSDKQSDLLFKLCQMEVKEAIEIAKFKQANDRKPLESAKVGSKAREEEKFIKECDIQALEEE